MADENGLKHALIQYLDAQEELIKTFRRQLLEAPVEPTKQQTTGQAPLKRDWDIARIKWAEAEGPNGSYLLAIECANTGNVDYQRLYDEIANQVGQKLYLGNMFFWQMANGHGIGRKEIKRQPK